MVEFIVKPYHVQKVSEYDQEIPQSHTADQPEAPDISCFENSADPAQIEIFTSFHSACNTCITGLDKQKFSA